jgi:hypothetical protein
MADDSLKLRFEAIGLETIGQLKTYIKDLKTEVSGLKVGSTELTAQQGKLATAQILLKDSTHGAITAGKGLHETYFKLGTVIREATVYIGAIVAAVYSLKKAFDAAEKSARMELLRSTMQQIAEKDGVNFIEMMDKINAKLGQHVSQYELLQAAMKLTLLDVDWQRIPEIMELAEKRSKLLGYSFEETMNIIENASLGGKRALRALKLNIDVEQSYKDFAETLGVLPKELNDVGKQHALFNAILEKAKEQNLDINKAAEAQLEKYERLKTSWANLGEAGGKLATQLSPLVDALAETASNMEKIIGKGHWYLLFLDGYYKLIKENIYPNRGLKRMYGEAGRPTITGEDRELMYPPKGGTSAGSRGMGFGVSVPTIVPPKPKPAGKSKFVNWEEVNARREKEEADIMNALRDQQALEIDMADDEERAANQRIDALDDEARLIENLRDKEDNEAKEKLKLHQQEMENWKEEHQYITGPMMSAFDTLGAALKGQTVTLNDLWQGVKNSVIDALMSMAAQYVINAIAAEAIAAITTATTVASMAAIAVAAAPAATLVSIATLGAGALTGTAAVVSGLATIEAMTAAAIAFDQGGTLYEPVIGIGTKTGRMYKFGENAPQDPEQFMPTSRGGMNSVQMQPVEINLMLGNKMVERVVVNALGKASYHRMI